MPSDDIRARIVAEARTWLDTPWRHQGRRKGVGVDCIGLVVAVGRALDLLPPAADAIRDYGRRPVGAGLARLLAVHGRRRHDGPEPGDVVLLAAPRLACHVGIVGDRPGYLTLIHAHEPDGRVVEHRLGGRLEIRGVYAYPGVG